jgi:dihydropyrimidinase
LDYVQQEKGKTLQESVDAWRKRADSNSAIDYGFHVIITEPNSEVLDEIKSLVRQGITSFKLFMANDISMRDKDL